MKKCYNRKAIALLLAFALLIGLCACSSQPAPPAGSPDSSTVSSGDEAPGDQAAEGPFGLDPNHRVTLSCFFDFTWYPISEWKGIIADEITRLTGVDMGLASAVFVPPEICRTWCRPIICSRICPPASSAMTGRG